MSKYEKRIGLLPASKLTLEFVLGKIDQSIEKAELRVKTSRLAETPEGEVALKYALTTGGLLSPILRFPSQTLASNLYEDVEGNGDDNQYKKIDLIGDEIFNRLKPGFRQPYVFFVEERKRWNKVRSGNELMVVIDPFDETSAYQKGGRVQSSAIVILDEEAGLAASAIVNLIDQEILFIEKRREKYAVQLLTYDTDRYILRETRLPSVINEEIQIATLPRRISEISVLFENIPYPQMPTFGGFGLMAVLRGETNIVFDPKKGQPWYEAVQVGLPAEKMGLRVTDGKGHRINWGQLIDASFKDVDIRQTIAISNLSEVEHLKLLSDLKLPDSLLRTV
ncbi:hypothetical protein A2153_01025 [Candidatus Gottesmanbacteria bacterium RBG_16_38_7b]|uniref:Uncharacterized protein n=1 Tax=Candidatus Gottesmanbacteria bacterium RBG_16_38_7b TaxID=1798372 RepID=A0A1F5YIQ0_9BACT|nr:MAG: hypothetical protein A2153_01025 [Candidatus Gottesmanbacteria bacterium RBG_16_38_7b]